MDPSASSFKQVSETLKILKEDVDRDVREAAMYEEFFCESLEESFENLKETQAMFLESGGKSLKVCIDKRML